VASDPQALVGPEVAFNALRRHLIRLRWRLRLALGVFIGARALSVLCGAAAIAILLHKLQGILYPAELVWVAPGVAVVAAVLGAIAWPLPDARVAVAADRRLGARDRLGTAVELAGAADRSGMDCAQIADALNYAGRQRAADAFAVRTGRSGRWAVGCLLALLVVHFAPIPPLLLSKRQREDQDRLRAVAHLLKPEAERLQRKADETGDEETSEVARRLERLAREMQRGRVERKQALVQLDEIQKDLEKLHESIRPPSLKTAQAAREEMSREGRQRLAAQARDLAWRAERKGDKERAEQLKKLAERAEQARNPEELMKAAEQMAQHANALGHEMPLTAAIDVLSLAIADENWDAAAAMLEGLQECLSAGDQELTPKEAAELAEAMEKLAKQLEGTELADLAECLRKAGECLKQGDCKGAAACLGASEGREGMSAAQLRSAIRRAGKCAGKCAGQCSGRGQRPGQGAGGPSPQEHIPPNAPGTSLYTPRETPVDADPTRVRAGVRPGGDMAAVTTRGAPETASESRVPYYEVIDDYSQAAEDALSHEEVPPAYRQTVRDYFESLQNGRETTDTTATAETAETTATDDD
jgi:hypothetical protein